MTGATSGVRPAITIEIESGAAPVLWTVSRLPCVSRLSLAPADPKGFR